MGVFLQQLKEENVDKIKIGACLELLFLLDNLSSDFKRIEETVDKYSSYISEQDRVLMNKQFDDIFEVLTNNVDLLINFIDKTEKYCDFNIRYY